MLRIFAVVFFIVTISINFSKAAPSPRMIVDDKKDPNCFWLSADVGQGWEPFKVCALSVNVVGPSKRGPNPVSGNDSPIRSKYMEDFLSRQVRASNQPNNDTPIRSKYMEEFLSRQV